MASTSSRMCSSEAGVGEDAMKMSFYCGHYKKFESLVDEPDECQASGTIEVDDDDWKCGVAYI